MKLKKLISSLVDGNFNETSEIVKSFTSDKAKKLKQAKISTQKKEEDDTGISDYFLNDIENIKIGEYQVVWSENDDFDAFDEITVEEINSQGLKITKDGETRNYSFSDVSTVEVVKMEDYDSLFK